MQATLIVHLSAVQYAAGAADRVAEQLVAGTLAEMRGKWRVLSCEAFTDDRVEFTLEPVDAAARIIAANQYLN